MSIEKAESIKASLPANNQLMATGHKYNDPVTGVGCCIEFHVDDHDCMQDYAYEMYDVYGGNIRICRPADCKPLVIRQDESIFNQFSFVLKQWVGPSGERFILPKQGFNDFSFSKPWGKGTVLLWWISYSAAHPLVIVCSCWLPHQSFCGIWKSTTTTLRQSMRGDMGMTILMRWPQQKSTAHQRNPPWRCLRLCVSLNLVGGMVTGQASDHADWILCWLSEQFFWEPVWFCLSIWSHRYSSSSHNAKKELGA